MKYLFLDTSVLLHYQSFEDVPWNRLLGVSDAITIVICETVIAEIDKHKDGQRSKLRDRAKRISRQLSSIFLEGKSSQTPVVFVPYTSPTEQEAIRYDVNINDNRILLSALHCQYPSTDIVMVSADNNLLIKSQQAGLNIFKMEDQYRLSEEPTNEEKELKNLQQQLASYQNRLSAPILKFHEEDNTHLKVKQPIEPDIETQLLLLEAEESGKYPKDEGDEEVTFDNYFSTSLIQMAQRWNVRTPEQRHCYNKMREEYLEAYRQQQTLLLQQQYEHSCFYPLVFDIINTGTAQTGDMFIQIDFPAHIPLYTEEESMTSHSYPRLVPPQNHRPLNLSFTQQDNKMDIMDKTRPVKERQYTKEYSRLIQGLSRKIDTGFYVDLRQFSQMVIHWTIADASLPHHVQGDLTLEVEPSV